MTDPSPNTPPPTRAVLDPGWLFLVAGLAILGATVLIPAADDLAQARLLRDQALSLERHRQDRLDRYESFLGAITQEQPALVLALAASQLNQIPADRSPVPGLLPQPTPNASVFPALEPEPLVLPTPRPVNSLLHRLTTGERSRVWMIAGGVLCILLGLLPPAKGTGPRPW